MYQNVDLNLQSGSYEHLLMITIWNPCGCQQMYTKGIYIEYLYIFICNIINRVYLQMVKTNIIESSPFDLCEIIYI